MIGDLPPKLWLPPKPAIVRAASLELTKLAMPIMGTFAAASVQGLRHTAAATADFEVLVASTQTLSSAGTTVTISSVDFLTGGTVVLALARGNLAASSVSISSVTISGATASVDVESVGGATAADCHIYIATSVPAGTGDIVITYSGSQQHTSAYAAYLIGSRTLEATDSTNATATSITDTVNVSSGGVVISAALHNANSATSDFNGGVDTDARGAFRATDRPAMVGHREYPSAATPATVTTSTSSSATARSATASYS